MSLWETTHSNHDREKVTPSPEWGSCGRGDKEDLGPAPCWEVFVVAGSPWRMVLGGWHSVGPFSPAPGSH